MSSAVLKLERLRAAVRAMDSAAVAFSGGADSALVARVAKDELGDRAIAVTVDSPLLPRSELSRARRVARSIGIHHEVVHVDPLSGSDFADNPVDRCYLCKTESMRAVKDLADRKGISDILDGSNADDHGDYRPGSKALDELGIRSPLSEAGMTKRDIRACSRGLRLPTHAKSPSPCLASRIPYGERITRARLLRIEKAEDYLKRKGFDQVRVRDSRDTARIEVSGEQIHRLSQPKLRKEVVRRMKALGYSYVCLDLQGYRTGSLNEVLGK
jgi:uncharacterized protein